MDIEFGGGLLEAVAPMPDLGTCQRSPFPSSGRLIPVPAAGENLVGAAMSSDSKPMIVTTSAAVVPGESSKVSPKAKPL